MSREKRWERRATRKSLKRLHREWDRQHGTPPATKGCAAKLLALPVGAAAVVATLVATR